MEKWSRSSVSPTRFVLAPVVLSLPYSQETINRSIDRSMNGGSLDAKVFFLSVGRKKIKRQRKLMKEERGNQKEGKKLSMKVKRI